MALDIIKEMNTIKEIDTKSENNLPYQTNLLPPTPTSSDDEQEQERQKDPVRLTRRQTLADLIPAASAALRAKKRLSNNEPTQNSPLARALTKVKIGVQTHRIKERYLTHEWIRLALATPLDDSTINSTHRVRNTSRTKEIVSWYEWKNKRTRLSIDELEKKVDILRRKKLIQQLPPSPPHSSIVF